jgi:predicted nuclease of predicted toxin-antitoxin system
MRVRFIADADLNYSIVAALKRREPGVDFLTAAAAGLEGLPDSEVLEVAARQGRILVTHDRRTMSHHFGEFVQTRTSPGVFIVSQNLPPSDAAEELLLIWSATEAEEWENRIYSLPV